MNRLAIILTHPIQYYVPVFKLLHQEKEIEIRVFYTWGEAVENKYDPGFGRKIQWDIPLLEGYTYEWVINTAPDPGSHHFKGVRNPFLIQRIETWQADAVLVFGWAYQSHLKVMRHFKNKIPVYFRGDSTLLDERPGLRKTLKTIFLRWVYRHIDLAFYTGTNNRFYFEKYGLKKARLIFAPHAIDNARFSEDRTADANRLRQQLNIPNDSTVILFSGKFEEKKDPALLLEAFISLDASNAHLLFVGNGILENELKVKAQKYTNIHFMDFQNQSLMPVIYQAVDLFCLPSKGPGESWGLAVNEAMASGKAVLVSNKVGCAADLVKRGVNGELFIAGDLEDLKEKLDDLLGDVAKLRTYGKNSRQNIASWSIENQVAAIVHTLIGNNAG